MDRRNRNIHPNVWSNTHTCNTSRMIHNIAMMCGAAMVDTSAMLDGQHQNTTRYKGEHVQGVHGYNQVAKADFPTPYILVRCSV